MQENYICRFHFHVGFTKGEIMSKKDYTHIIVVLDRSGSISTIRDDMEGGFNDFIKDQKAVEGEATLTLAQFENDYEVVHDNIVITDVPDLILSPRGGTALLDAIGRSLTTERERIKDMDENDQPDKIICVVITDGMENSSHEYDRKKIMDMIKDLEAEEDPQWDFVFLGANQDAIAEGGSMGVRAESSYTYAASSIGTQIAFRSLSGSMTTHRSATKGKRYEFTEEDRKDQEKVLNQKSDNKFGKAIPSYVSDLVTTDDEK